MGTDINFLRGFLELREISPGLRITDPGHEVDRSPLGRLTIPAGYSSNYAIVRFVNGLCELHCRTVKCNDDVILQQ